MFTNGYLYALFLFVTAYLLITGSDNPKDITLGVFLIFIGVLSGLFERYKRVEFVQNLLRRFF